MNAHFKVQPIKLPEPKLARLAALADKEGFDFVDRLIQDVTLIEAEKPGKKWSTKGSRIIKTTDSPYEQGTRGRTSSGLSRACVIILTVSLGYGYLDPWIQTYQIKYRKHSKMRSSVGG